MSVWQNYHLKVSNTAFTSQSQVSSGSRQSRPAQVKSTKDQLLLFSFFKTTTDKNWKRSEVGGGGGVFIQSAEAG